MTVVSLYVNFVWISLKIVFYETIILLVLKSQKTINEFRHLYKSYGRKQHMDIKCTYVSIWVDNLNFYKIDIYGTFNNL